MTVGALIDAGVPLERIENELKKIDLQGYRLETMKVNKEGISATKFDVIAEEEEHDHRHYSQIVRMIDQSTLAARVKERSKQIFAPIAQSEAKIHGTTIEKVHFHEVGAVDSIVDIVATAAALEELGIEKIVASHVPLGSGTVRCAHGLYPVPAPATLDIMKNIPIAASDLPYELTTPTGAGIVASQSESFGPMPAMKVAAIGYGAGNRDIKGRPNVLRVMIGETIDQSASVAHHIETITVLECQVDDMTGETLGYVMEKLFGEGALDVYYSPVYMKKNRPGTLITVLARRELETHLSNILLTETTTLGVRKSEMSRRMLDRQTITADTPFGRINVKQALCDGKVIRNAPEYEDVKKAAQQYKTTFQEVYSAVLRVI